MSIATTGSSPTERHGRFPGSRVKTFNFPTTALWRAQSKRRNLSSFVRDHSNQARHLVAANLNRGRDDGLGKTRCLVKQRSHVTLAIQNFTPIPENKPKEFIWYRKLFLS